MEAPVRRLAAPQYYSGGRSQTAGEASQQRRFSGAIVSADYNQFSTADSQIDGT